VAARAASEGKTAAERRVVDHTPTPAALAQQRPALPSRLPPEYQMTSHFVQPTPNTLFSRASLWQSWLDVEAAMALAQAEIGMIPDWAATEIARQARLDVLDLDALERSVAETMAPIVSLVRALVGVCGDAGKFVHWGGTTQNIMSTGRLLLVRRAHRAMSGHIAGALDILGQLAETHADTIMAGRTNNRHALPITFGFKVAGWIEELARQNERFATVENRVFALYFGGAIGAMHSFGSSGEALSVALARRLDLTAVLVPSRASLDSQAEYVASLGLFAMGVGRIAADLYRLMSQEIDEVAEHLGDGVIGSSTMPHKVNPKNVVHLIATAAQLRAKVAPALEAGLPSYEGDAASNQLMSGTLESACALAWDLAQRFESTLAGLDIHATNMARNLDLSAPYIASERLMMVLAPKIGRSEAHDLVHHVVADALAGRGSVAGLLLAVPEVAAKMSAADLAEAMEPANYLGDSKLIARRAADLAQSTASGLRNRVAG
jgi:3-carboxy-cis,cis-muconate cycloisomerase